PGPLRTKRRVPKLAQDVAGRGVERDRAGRARRNARRREAQDAARVAAEAADARLTLADRGREVDVGRDAGGTGDHGVERSGRGTRTEAAGVARLGAEARDRAVEERGSVRRIARDANHRRDRGQARERAGVPTTVRRL